MSANLYPRSRRRRVPRAFAAVAAGALLADVLSAPGTGSPQALALQASTSTSTSTASTAASALPAGTARTVTLPTGDTVTLTADGTGQYDVTGGAANTSRLILQSVGRPATGASAVYAIPLNAAELVTDGALDRGMFDALWLAGHQGDGPSGHLDVVLQYGGHPATSWLAQHGAAFAGTKVLATSATDATVTVEVAASKAQSFWQALTGQDSKWRPPARLARPQLADGIGHAWLAQHQTPAVTATADQPLYTVTETITKKGGLLPLGPVMIGVSGSGLDQSFQPVSESCLDSLCETSQIVFQVPQGVYDAEDDAGVFFIDGEFQLMDVADPQITVAGDTSFTIDANKASEVTVRTPRPSLAYLGDFHTYRITADGAAYEGFMYGAAWQGTHLWATPSPHRVTIGSYYYESARTMGAPPVTMTVVGQRGLQLDPLYQAWSAFTDSTTASFLRFSGDHVRGLVAAGHGSTADFAGVDARGKLVLLAVQPDAGCRVYDWQLDNARQAGAVGVIFDPRDPSQGQENPGYCEDPLPDYQDAGSLPFVTIHGGEAASLLSLLGRGPVSIDVADSGETPYIYNLKFFAEGRIPASLSYTVTDRQLTTIDARYHASAPTPMAQYQSGVRSDTHLLLQQRTYAFIAPRSITEYYGPTAPDLVWQRELDTNGAAHLASYSVNTYAGGHQQDDWDPAPAAPGAVTLDGGAVQAIPDYPQATCSMCRQADFFFPSALMVSGTDPLVGTVPGTEGDIHLYAADGTEIQQATDHGIPGYALSAQQARYRLTATYDNTATSWQFSSAHPAAANASSSVMCIGTLVWGDTDTCAADPLIFLRYDAHVSLANAVSALGRHQIQVTPYYQASTAPAQITGLKLWTSTDGGRTWQPATVHRGGDGSYTADYQVPDPGSAGGTVSLRAQATDSAGDTIDQTITGAFAVTAGH